MKKEPNRQNERLQALECRKEKLLEEIAEIDRDIATIECTGYMSFKELCKNNPTLRHPKDTYDPLIEFLRAEYARATGKEAAQ